MLTWDQAVSDYEKKKKQPDNETASLPTSGMISWQQAADEFDQHDEEGYKALGQQRINERQQKVVQREERATVSDWFRRYNSVMQGASDYKSRGRAESLIADFEGIKDLAERYGVTDSGKYLDQLNQILDYYNQFDSEDAYNSYVSQREQYEAMSNFDTKAGAREIAQLESTLAEYQNLTRWMTDEKGEARAAAIRQQYGGEDEIQALIQQKRQYLNQSQRLQDGIAMSAVVDNPDFKEMSGYVSTENNEGALQKALSYGIGLGLGYDDLTYEYINNQNGIRDEVKQRFRVYTRSGDESPYEKKGYDYLTDDEISIYNYHYSKDGKEAAEAYLDSIQETLSHRKATSMFANMEDHTALEIAFGLVAGLDQFESGMKSLGQAISGEADYIPASAYQIASGMVREDLGDVGAKLPEWMGGATLGQMGYDTVTTSANMLPSIVTSMALSAINPVVGSVTGSAMVGASAGGNAYQEMLNLGYDKGQAETYATLIGGLEGCLQYLLGGIGSLGGKVSGNVVGKILNGVDNAFARTAIKLGGNMLSEGFEEGLQEILAPWIQNLVLHADEDIDWGEVAYSSLLGALTAGFMEGGSTISGEVNTYQTGRQLQGGGITAQRLADIGTTFSADTVAHQLAGRVNENTGAYTMGRLFNEIGAELTEQNKADIVQSLVNKGVDPDHARIHADVMAYIMDGGQLSDIQMRMIEQNDVLAKTMQEVIIDPNSTVNQRIKGFNEAYAALTGKTPEVSVPVAEQPAQTEAATPSGNTVPTAEEVPAEGHYESSAEGKTILKSSGETVTIKEIASIKGGKMTLKLDDGRTVDASDVSYSSQDEALVYEAVADMGTNAVAADLLVKAFAPGGISAQDYVHGIKEAYTYGQYNFPMKEVENGPFASMLSAEQRNTAYKLGQIFSGKQVAKEQATVRRNRTVAKNATTVSRKETVGKVHFDRKGRTFDDVREVSLKTMEQLSAALGIEFYVFESYVNEHGQRVYKGENGKEAPAPNGFYDPKDGSIHIDLNAGRDGKGTMLFTIAHELTHFIRQWSPAKFKVLANFLNEQYGARGKSVSALVEEQIAKAKRNGRTISYAVAYEEVVADSMESMLTDGNVVQMMSDLAQQDKSLWQKICDWFKDLVSDLKAIVDAYTGKSPDSIEGKLVADMQDVIIILESLYADALVDARENRQTAPKAEKNTTQEGGAKFQTRNVNGGQVVWIENSGFSNAQLRDPAAIAQYIAQHIGDVYRIIESGQKIYIGKDLPGEYTHSKYTSYLQKKKPALLNAKNKASSSLGEMIEIATNRRWEATKHTASKDAKYGMYRYDTKFAFPVKDQNGNVTTVKAYDAELLIRNASNGKKYLYDIVNIKEDTANAIDLRRKEARKGSHAAATQSSVSTPNVAQNATEVNKKFSMREPVERTKNLVALHNLTEDKLEKALKLGGFPMPSIAITKTDIPHTNFGDITLVFGSEVIDPKKSRKNVVYSADAWTPTFPRIEYEADDKIASQVHSRLSGLSKQVDEFFRRDLGRVTYDMEDILNRYDGEEGLIQYALDNYGLKAAYLEERGEHIQPENRQEEVTLGVSLEMEDKYLRILEVLDIYTPEQVSGLILKDVRDKHGKELEEIYPGVTKSALRLGRVLNRIRAYLSGVGMGTEYKTVTDAAATNAAIDSKLDSGEYEAWVRDLFRNIEKSRGVHNNKDRFTPSGKRRTFKQTHLPATLENIVKAMATQNGGSTKNVSGFNGIKTLRAGTAKRFRSIAEMHEYEGRLQNLTEDQLAEIQDQLGSRLYDIIKAIDEEGAQLGGSNSLIRYDSIGETLTEIAEGGRYNVSDIQKKFAEYRKELSDELAAQVKELLFDVTQMPVNIYEAKPERAVLFEEIRAAILPNDTSEGVVDGLRGHGVPVHLYEPGNNTARLDLINGLEGVRFSDRDSEGNQLSEEQRAFFAQSKMRNEFGRLKVMYHGTDNAGFTKFMANYSKDLRSFFFTDRLTNAASYSGTMDTVAPARSDTLERKPGNMAVYLDIKNPLYIDTEGDTWDYIRYEPEDPDEADELESFIWDTRDLAKYAKDKGYDGLILESLYDYGAEMDVDNEASTVAVVFKPEQIKSINNLTPTSDPDIRYSDREYLDAVNSGDMRTAQRMVDEAAERWGAYRNNDEANEVFHQDSRIRTFYHGTNTGDFTIFDGGLLGSSSGDLGWFGKGFYFAFSYGEAVMYGGRVIPAYLRIRKPFDYSQLYKFKGSDKGSSQYSRFAWVYNITKQFPDLAEGQQVWAYPDDAEDGSAVGWKQLTDLMDRIQKEKQFSVEEVELNDGTTAWELRADPKKESFTNDDGETFEWTKYGMTQIFATEQDAKEPINQVGAYLKNVMGIESIPRRTIEKIDLSGAVQRAGYDGILQSMSGDEAVVFSPEQIKTSEPVTYDDKGNVIPLSKRFDSGNPDIRFSERDPEQQRVNRVLEKENAKLREDVTYLKELLKLQRSVTGGKKFTRTSVEAAATKLMKDASARGQKAELVGLLNGFYEYIAGGEELTWESVVEQAQPVVRWLMAHESAKKQTNEYAADILRELRGTRISLDGLQKKEVAYQYGSFNEFRKKTMGSIIVTNSGTPLDVQWIELSRQYPHIFNPETTSNDMPSALLDAISNLRSMPADDVFGYDGEMAAMDLLHQVYDSYWSVSTLYTVADVKQREINRLKSAHHQRMADLRETHRENTAKLKQQHSEDLKRVRTEMRNAANARMEKTVQKYQESRQRGIESRNKTAMRQKIKRVVSDLNQYLLNGTKDRHVPIELQKAVAEALDAVNMDSVGAEERIAKLNKDLVKAKKPAQIQEISRKIDNIRAMGDRMSDRLKALHDAYEEIKNDEDPLMSNVYDDGLSAHMMTLIVEVGDTPLREMSMHQLECVYDVYQIVLTTIRNANKAFKTAKSESIASMGNMAMMEVRGIGGKKRYGMKGMDAVKEFGWNNLKPVYAFEHIGSNTLTKLFNNVRAGEDVWAVDVTEAREYYLDKAKRYKYNSWDFAKRHTFKSTSGMDFSLNLEQIMSLYAYSKRDQAADHLRRGGIVIDETTEVTMKTKLGIPVKFNPTEATAYNISDMTLAEIVGTLTPEQKGFVDEMQDYLSTVMGGKGNEVSLAMYGIKLFKEKFYFPLKSAPQFMAKAKEQQQGEVKIKNAGFSKQTVKKASNPIVLTPFMNVWADHVNEMSMYHAFVLPMEDFYRVYNFKTPTSEGTATQSVEMTIQNAYGKGATKYIDQLLKDLNGGARTDSTTGIINKGMALFKKGAVFASLSVVIQQPSAIARATALIDTKYFIGPKVDHKKHKALWAELKQYAPVAIIKEMGYFDTNMGKSTQDFILGKEYSGFDEKMKALVTDSNYRDEILSKAPALADELAWCSIWEAVKRETVAKNPGLAANSDEFLQKAGQRFTEVITKTQVYDSVLSRSALMRSKDTGMKMATAFMAEPTTSINMVADALLKGKRGNRKYARGAIGAVIASNILNSILVSFVYAGRDDDEDKTYAEKYIGTLAGEVLDSLNPATYIPFIKDIVSIVQGYDVERSDMAVISDLWNAWKKLSSGNLSAWQKVEGFAGSIAQIFGLPVKNIMRDVRGIYQTIQSFMSGQKTTGAGIGYAVKSAITGQDTSNKQQLYEAYLSGDKAQISRVERRFKDQSAINSAIRTALRENDSRIHAAAVARTNGNLTEYTRLAKEIIAEGHFSQDNVVAAINAEINAMKKGDTASASKALGLYKVEDFAAAVSGGDSAMADAVRDDIIQTAQKNGKTADEAEKGFISSAKTAMKELFLGNGITETQAINALVSYCGETGDEAKQRVSEWAFEAEFGFAYGEKVQKFKDGEISAAELKGILIDVDGKTDDEAAASIVSYSRDGYEEGFFSRDETAELMMQYGGLTRSEAEAKLRYIDFKIANPDVYADDAWIDEYYKEVQSSGISIDLFVEYRNRVKSMTGSNKKAQRMAVIDSLPISNDQKDALYYAEGWASSKLYEAPWR